MASDAGLGLERTRSVLSHLCQVGRAMYDLSTTSYRHRDLFPTVFTLKEAYAAANPILADTSKPAADARTIVAKDDVRIIARRPTKDGFKLSGSAKGEDGQRVRPLLTVNLAGEIVEGSCTCSFFRSHQLTKGPCEHLLALRLRHMQRLTNEGA